MNQITVLFFATLRDKAGARSVLIEVDQDTTVAGLKKILIERYPLLSGLMDHCLASINHEYHFDEDVIPNAAEIAFFPPVSGG